MANPFLSTGHSMTQKPELGQFFMHTHENYEIYCFLTGNAKYYVEGNVYPLKPGDILVMKKAEAHSLFVNSCVPYERIVISFNADALVEESREELCHFLDNRPLGLHNRYAASKFKESNWLYYLMRMCKTERLSEKQLYLSILVNELYESYPLINTETTAPGDTVVEIIGYINQHLTEPLSLDTLCHHFFISKAHLNRKFKMLTGSTVWEYILTKRLLAAKDLLQNGETPTKVYSECGFNDYCSFFKSYKAKFGVSPKNDCAKL